MCLAQGPQHSDAGEAQTRGPLVSSQALYHWATALQTIDLIVMRMFLKNYRGIVISRCLSKLFSKILHNRIEKHINDNSIMNENQTGFRKHYRTADHILTLISIIEKIFKKK